MWGSAHPRLRSRTRLSVISGTNLAMMPIGKFVEDFLQVRVAPRKDVCPENGIVHEPLATIADPDQRAANRVPDPGHSIDGTNAVPLD